MAEILEAHDLTGPDDDGWKVFYPVRRDGHEGTVDASLREPPKKRHGTLVTPPRSLS